MLSWRPHSNAYSIFLSHLSKVLRLPQKSEVPHLWHKIILANLMIWCSKRHPSGNLLPDLQKMTASYVSWTARATWTACLQILPRKTTLERPKVVRTWCVLTILTSRCASPHNRVNFLDISTSKSGLRLSVFNTFVVEMCNSVHFFNISTHKGAPNPQCFQSTFWLPNLLRATAACTISTSHHAVVSTFWLPNVLCATAACGV